jgi:carbamoyl-phosphate synthase large subunit
MTDRSVLVTAVGGGGVGEQIVKALRLAERPFRIVGTDTDWRSAGLQDVDIPVIVPYASAPAYLETVLGVCRRLDVRGLFPGSEPELLALASARRLLAAAGVVLFANADEVIATGLDKAATAAALARHGFRPPRSLMISGEADLPQVPFLPAILKPVTGGGGSADVFVVQTAAELRLFGAHLLSRHQRVLAQEYIGTAADEYTVGILSDLDGSVIHSIAVRRNILPAFSNRSRVENRTGNPVFGEHLVVSNGISQGEIGPFPEVTLPCERMAASLGSRGPLNIQCRFVDGEVRVFEINPRFSGTTSLRALAGFNEPDLLYRRHVENEVLTPRFSYRSLYLARALREVVVDPALEGASVGTGDFRWALPSLPFVYRPLDSPSNGAGLPDFLPLTLELDRESGLLRQSPDPNIAAALERAYAAGSEVPGVMEAGGIGKDYAEDFLTLLAETTDGKRAEGVRVLEIGCGTGYLLSRLKGLGMEVQGVEPGPHGQQGPQRYGVPVVRGFFPAVEITGLYDLVVLYLVLEHVPEAGRFLESIRARVAPEGRVALVVPDAEPYLEEGDASILFHEHYSYFTPITLEAILRANGATRITFRRSALSRLLFAVFSFDGAARDLSSPGRSLAGSLTLAHRFRNSVQRTTKRLSVYLAQAHALNRTVAIYVPGRFINYVPLGALTLERVRFFDDSPALHGRYYPGIRIPVESRDALIADPCDQVLIMSASFGARIAAELRPALPEATRIITLTELLR